MRRYSSAIVMASLFLSLSNTALSQSLDYRAPLQPMNPQLTEPGLTGEVQIRVLGDELSIRVEADGLAPEMMHLQHLHGSRDGMDAECAPMALKTPQDEITDLLDTRQYSGITLIPLHDDPASLEIKTDTYPVSNRAGAYVYEATVNWERLQRAMAEKYDMDLETVDLGRMVVYVHGVATDTKLPESVRSLPGVPAHATLPVACAELDIQPLHK
ncbi:hypothetical protein F6455_07450 [Proteobacteria bacterium 005FR1]|nr:hypothetical protein [Proteobacteria bacterium 005FR1]